MCGATIKVIREDNELSRKHSAKVNHVVEEPGATSLLSISLSLSLPKKSLIQVDYTIDLICVA